MFVLRVVMTAAVAVPLILTGGGSWVPWTLLIAGVGVVSAFIDAGLPRRAGASTRAAVVVGLVFVVAFLLSAFLLGWSRLWREEVGAFVPWVALALAALAADLVEAPLRKRDTATLITDEVTSVMAIAFETTQSLDEMRESVRVAKGYEWAEGRSPGFGKYLRALKDDAVIKLVPFESGYVLEVEFSLDGRVKPADRSGFFREAREGLLPLVAATAVRENPTSSPSPNRHP